MSQFVRTRDCVILFRGDGYTVTPSPAMLAKGWIGGQWVQWWDSPRDEFAVTFSDGRYGGFLLWGSNEVSDQITGMTDSQITYAHALFCAGGWMVSVKAYEKYTWTSRQGPGPLVPIQYTVGERLLISLNGYLTNEDEWTLSGDPRAPNGLYIAYVIQEPSDINEHMLMVQTSV